MVLCIIAIVWVTKELLIWLFTDMTANPATSVDSLINVLE